MSGAGGPALHCPGAPAHAPHAPCPRARRRRRPGRPRPTPRRGVRLTTAPSRPAASRRRSATQRRAAPPDRPAPGASSRTASSAARRAAALARVTARGHAGAGRPADRRPQRPVLGGSRTRAPSRRCCASTRTSSSSSQSRATSAFEFEPVTPELVELRRRRRHTACRAPNLGAGTEIAIVDSPVDAPTPTSTAWARSSYAGRHDRRGRPERPRGPVQHARLRLHRRAVPARHRGRRSRLPGRPRTATSTASRPARRSARTTCSAGSCTRTPRTRARRSRRSGRAAASIAEALDLIRDVRQHPDRRESRRREHEPRRAVRQPAGARGDRASARAGAAGHGRRRRRQRRPGARELPGRRPVRALRRRDRPGDRQRLQRRPVAERAGRSHRSPTAATSTSPRPATASNLWYPPVDEDTGAVTGPAALAKGSGTSFAAPMVAGVVALLAARPTRTHALTGDAARAAIIASAPRRPGNVTRGVGKGDGQAPAGSRSPPAPTPYTATVGRPRRLGRHPRRPARRRGAPRGPDRRADPDRPTLTVTSGFGTIAAATPSSPAVAPSTRHFAYAGRRTRRAVRSRSRPPATPTP